MKLAGALWYQKFGSRAMCILGKHSATELQTQQEQQLGLLCAVSYLINHMLDAIANGY